MTFFWNVGSAILKERCTTKYSWPTLALISSKPGFIPFTCLEALVDVLERAKKFIKKILSDQQGKTVVVVSHGIAIRCIVSAAVGIPLVAQTHLWLDNSSVSLIQHTKNAGWDLHFFNFTGHLTGLGGIKRG